MTTLEHFKYLLSELSNNWRDREWRRGRILNRVIRPVHTKVYPKNRGSIHVMEKDWDNLVILDACRHDLFSSVVDVTQFRNYKCVRSLGSATSEWTRNNFQGRSFGDTVYVSSNPFITKYAPDSFHSLIEVWADSFDEEQGTVSPEAMFGAALEAHDAYPEKRLIVHLMQPHYPFRKMKFSGWHPDEIVGDKDLGELHDPWEALKEGVVSEQDVWAAYEDNLKYGMETVERLLDELQGKTVVTSDHGNMFGERGFPFPMKIYGHPERLRFPELVNVPWATSMNGPRRNILPEGTEKTSVTDEEMLQDRLQALGYKE